MFYSRYLLPTPLCSPPAPNTSVPSIIYSVISRTAGSDSIKKSSCLKMLAIVRMLEMKVRVITSIAMISYFEDGVSELR